MDITDAILDRKKRDENKLAATKKDMDHMCHLAKYYQDSTQEIVFLRSEFRETYAEFTNEINLFTSCIANFQ
jgi:phospholipid N-methyltransferase